MSFTNGKPFFVNAVEMSYAWSGARDGRNFRCQVCGRFFGVGDYAIFVYANGSGSPAKCGNFLACSTADGPVHGTKAEMLTAIADAEKLIDERYWWALPHQQRPHNPAQQRDRKADRWDP